MSKALAGAALLATAATATAMPSYAPLGPQQNVAFNTVTSGGWSQCFAGDYGNTGINLGAAVSGCSGDLLMLAGANNASGDIQLLAWALKSEVLTYTAQNVTHAANGSFWYLNNFSMGFAPTAGISQNSADTSNAPGFGGSLADGANRLSWHTTGSFGDINNTFINGGWRVGNNTFLNGPPGGTGFTRYIFTADSAGQAVPEPAGLALLGLGLAVAGGLSRRRRG